MAKVIGYTLSTACIAFVCFAAVSFVRLVTNRSKTLPPVSAHVSDTYAPVALAHSFLLLAVGLVIGIIAFVVWRSNSAAEPPAAVDRPRVERSGKLNAVRRGGG